jgi:hypothetical protein
MLDELEMLRTARRVERNRAAAERERSAGESPEP